MAKLDWVSERARKTTVGYGLQIPVDTMISEGTSLLLTLSRLYGNIKKRLRNYENGSQYYENSVQYMKKLLLKWIKK